MKKEREREREREGNKMKKMTPMSPHSVISLLDYLNSHVLGVHLDGLGKNCHIVIA